MASINSMFPSKFLPSADLQGRTFILGIDEVKREEVDKGKERKPVVYFAGAEKGLVLNKVNAEATSDLIGSWETDDWPGHRIKLYAARVEYQGKTVDGIRVDDQSCQPPNGKTKTAAVPPRREPEAEAGNDNIPF